MDESAGKALKRRGLMAGAAALVAGIAAQRASQPVGATSGGGPDGPLVMGSNFGNTPNRATNLTVFTTVAGTFNYPALFGVDANVGGATNANLDGLYGTGKGTGVGVIGFTEQTPTGSGLNATGNAAVYGLATNGRTGVVGQSDGGQGVHGQSTAGTGVLGQSTAGVGVYGATVSGLYGVVGASGSSSGSAGLLGVATGPNAIGFGTIAQGGATFAGYFNGTTVVNGAFAVTGSKSAAVKDANGEYRLMYSVESPEAWFEDFGTGTLANGKADVKLDPQFAQHIHTDGYHVFITEHGENNALHVASRTTTGFAVQADDATLKAKGKSAASVNGTFSYRVVAKRNDITGERLAKFTMPPPLIAPEMPAPAIVPPVPPASSTVDDLPASSPAPLPPSRPSGASASGASRPAASPASVLGGPTAPGAPNPLPPSRP
jgi:hypothetical protein